MINDGDDFLCNYSFPGPFHDSWETCDQLRNFFLTRRTRQPMKQKKQEV